MRARAEERRLVKITRQEAAAAAAEEEEPTGAAVQQTPGKANRCEFGCGSTATAVPLSSALSSSHFLPHAPTAHHFSASASYSSSPSPAHTSSSSGACRSDTVSVRWVALGGGWQRGRNTTLYCKGQVRLASRTELSDLISHN